MWSLLRRVGGWLTAAALTVAGGYFVAITTDGRPNPLWPWAVIAGLAGAGGAAYLLGAHGSRAPSDEHGAVESGHAGRATAHVTAGHATERQPELRSTASDTGGRTTASGPAVTSRWRHTTDGQDVPALMTLSHTILAHPGYAARQPEETPPAVKIGVLVASDALDTAQSGTELRARFEALLAGQPISTIVRELTYVEPGMSWRSLAGHGLINLDAALVAGDDATSGVPAASALLLPAVAGLSGYGHNDRCAVLLLYIEPRTADGHVPPAAPPAVWRERFEHALAMPGALAEFLTKDLGLGTTDDPAAQLGIWLESHGQPLTAMIDTGGLTTLPGSTPANWFCGYAIADPQGATASRTAEELLRQMCEYTLHLDSYEQALAGGDAAARLPGALVQNTWQMRDLPVLAAVIRELERTGQPHLRVSEISEASGLDSDDVADAVKALDGTFLHMQRTLGEPSSWFVGGVTGEARRITGQWPS